MREIIQQETICAVSGEELGFSVLKTYISLNTQDAIQIITWIHVTSFLTVTETSAEFREGQPAFHAL